MRRLVLAFLVALTASAASGYEAVDAIHGRPRRANPTRSAAPMTGAAASRWQLRARCLHRHRARGRAHHKLDPHFFARLLWKESLFEPGAISPVGAQGIAQFMPGTAAMVGLDDPFNPAKAIEASARYLKQLSDGFGNLGLAAVAYNGGENRAARFKAQGGNLPWETQDYVQAITGKDAWVWRDNPPEALDIRLDKERSFLCRLRRAGQFAQAARVQDQGPCLALGCDRRDPSQPVGGDQSGLAAEPAIAPDPGRQAGQLCAAQDLGRAAPGLYGADRLFLEIRGPCLLQPAAQRRWPLSGAEELNAALVAAFDGYLSEEESRKGRSFLPMHAGQVIGGHGGVFPQAFDFGLGDAGLGQLEQIGVDVIIGDQFLRLFQQVRAFRRVGGGVQFRHHLAEGGVL
jgi:hypothetical protein